MISETARVHPNVELGENCIIDDFVVLGEPPRGAEPGELKTVIGSNAVIRSHTVVYAGNEIGDDFQTGNGANIRESNSIGHDVSVGTKTVIEHHTEIENGVRIHSQAFIPEYCIVREGAWVGPNVVLTNAKYPNEPDTKENLQGCVIGKGAVIGANATLLPGVTIEDGALVGAGAVVTSDVVESGQTVIGNPAKPMKSARSKSSG